jgi:8-oxoguanine deaminase
MPSLLLWNALVVATMNAERREIFDGAIHVVDNRIVAVGPADAVPGTADEAATSVAGSA